MRVAGNNLHLRARGVQGNKHVQPDVGTEEHRNYPGSFFTQVVSSPLTCSEIHIEMEKSESTQIRNVVQTGMEWYEKEHGY